MPNMSSPASTKAMLLLRALFKRRTRRASWAYILWLLAYLPLMVFIADFVFFHLRPYQYLPVLIPVAVIIVQLAYPTLLGWAVVVIPSVFVAGVGVVSVVITAPSRDLPHELRRPRYQFHRCGHLRARLRGIMVCPPKARGFGCCRTSRSCERWLKPSLQSIADSFLSINTFGASRDKVGP